MKIIILAFVLTFISSCTKSSSKSEAASKSLKNCNFKVLAFASYQDETGKMNVDYEDVEMWTQEGTHDYAIMNNSSVKSASVKLLKKGKVIKSVDYSLEKIGKKLTHLEDSGKLTKSIRSSGGMTKDSSLRFVFQMKDKKTCKQDVGVFAE